MSENNPHFLAMTANTIGEKILQYKVIKQLTDIDLDLE